MSPTIIILFEVSKALSIFLLRESKKINSRKIASQLCVC